MKIKENIGIDVSKKNIDVHVHSKNKHQVFNNHSKGIKKMIKWVFQITDSIKVETIFTFEHTGLYSLKLATILSEQKIKYAEVPGLEIKRSLGLARGKDDKADAAKIALYAYRLRDEIEPGQMPSEDLQSLKRLLSLRDRSVKQRAGYKASLKEEKRVLVQKENKTLLSTQEEMIGHLSKKIEKVEKELDRILKGNQGLDEMYKLITSIKGVGPQTALYVIVYTQGFTKFENWRKFASYCGTAPFPNSSGTSIRGKTKISHLANKKIKSLLDLCAKVAIRHNTEMKRYYDRRISEGKNKRSTINIIRNKILSRIFAVVQRKTPYVDFMKYAA